MKSIRFSFRSSDNVGFLFTILWGILLTISIPCHGKEIPSESFTTLTVGVQHDDNATLDLAQQEERSDWARDFRLRHGRLYQIAPRVIFTWAIDVRFLDFSTLNPLDQTHGGVRVSWRRKLGVGPRVPWWRVSAGFAGHRFDSSIRNRNIADVQLEIGKRLSDRAAATLALGKESSRGVNSRFFGGEAFSADLNGEIQLSGQLMLLAGYEFRDGSLSTTSNPNTDPLPWVRDPDFSSRTIAGGPKWIYRLDSFRSDRFSVGLRLTQNRNSSWNLMWEKLTTEKRDEWFYDRTQIRFAYVRSF